MDWFRYVDYFEYVLVQFLELTDRGRCMTTILALFSKLPGNAALDKQAVLISNPNTDTLFHRIIFRVNLLQMNARKVICQILAKDNIASD